MNDSQHLLDAYLRIWNNRTITYSNSTPDEILYELIKRELLDENAHPRTRKPKFEKFYSSIKRVVTSDLTEAEKTELVSVYVRVMEES